MRIAPEIGDVSIVLVGNLNPLIFHPSWFVRNQLFTEKEGEVAEINVIHSEISQFRMEWLTVRVEQTRFTAQTQEAPFVRLADLVVRTFKEFLVHTPIGMLGINRNVHFSVSDESTRNRIGKALAPHEPWGEWAKHIEGSAPEKRGGMRSLSMEQRDLDDRRRGRLLIKVEPSSRLEGGIGIYAAVNDHYEIDDPKNPAGCHDIIDILEKRFDKSIQRSEWLIDQVMALK
jgi:hypothetical protein